jgi:hypothetical protein
LTRHIHPIIDWLTHGAGLRATCQVNGFGLFESHLSASGAQYEAALHYPL